MSTRCPRCGKGWIIEGEGTDSCKRCKAEATEPQRIPASVDDNNVKDDDRFIAEKGIVFSEPLPGVQMKLDVFTPRSRLMEVNTKQPLPAIILVHGGGFTAGSRKDEARMARQLTARGLVAFCPSYRLAPKYVFPSPLDDLKNAFAWVIANASKYNVDPHRVGLYGYSAGGYLATWLALQPPFKVRCVAAGGAPWNIVAAPPNLGGMLWNFLGGSKADKPDAWQAACPTTAAEAARDDSSQNRKPTFFLWHGDADETVPTSGQLDGFVGQLRASGFTAEARILHANHLGAAIQSELRVDIISFLCRELEVDQDATLESVCEGQTSCKVPGSVDPAVVAVYKKIFNDNAGDKDKICKMLELDALRWISITDADAFCMKYLGST